MHIHVLVDVSLVITKKKMREKSVGKASCDIFIIEFIMTDNPSASGLQDLLLLYVPSVENN